MRVVFLGSGAFAIPSFESLVEHGHDVAALVTQPDKEKGRGRQLRPPPLKPVAERLGVAVLQPRRVREPDAVAALRALAPDVQVVVAYGQILPREVIEIPPHRTVNVHASLLPRYRGAAPIQWAIVRGETVTGVTTMLIDEGLDTGPTLLARRLTIGDAETAGELEPRLARLGGEVLLETLEGLATGSLHPQPQDPSQASLAPLIRKPQGRVDWSQPAVVIARHVRGFTPWPGAFTSLAGRSLKLLRTRAESAAGTGAPGTIVAIDAGGFRVTCGAGTRLLVTELQPESKRAMPAAAFAAGARLKPGARFDAAAAADPA